MKTVLITGCSSGYGLATARHFHAQGWNVVATMRTPRDGILPRSERLCVLPLDVTRPDSIVGGTRRERADRRARQQCGRRRGISG
jgi:NAD(P)-dependent dehydrogenase (short-subunit alcohol dehydrogenase family)